MIILNGVEYKGDNVTTQGGRVFVDGKEAIPIKEHGKFVVNIAGDIKTLNAHSAGEINITGNVAEIESRSSRINIQGNINGNIETRSGKVSCWNISGGVKTTSGKVVCEELVGPAETISGDIKCN